MQVIVIIAVVVRLTSFRGIPTQQVKRASISVNHLSYLVRHSWGVVYHDDTLLIIVRDLRALSVSEQSTST
ncbi:hypothetical protein F5X96DRAFT_656063 [Biscogniauxia mediterranea]|nr:hypothetical protein F5X96DRAFT_656063 [Biscogniauxia mediterranea]